MSKAFDSISKGLKEAIDYAEGKKISAKKFIPKNIDIKTLRKKIGMTQIKFATYFGINLYTLRHWERGDRTPQGPALILLNLLNKDPKTILNILNKC